MDRSYHPDNVYKCFGHRRRNLVTFPHLRCMLGGYGQLKLVGFRELNLKVQFGDVFWPTLVECKGI